MRHLNVGNKWFLLLLVVPMLLNSCIDSEYDFGNKSDEIVYNPNIALPIGSMTVNIDEFLAEFDSSQYIKTADDGFLYVIYERDVPAYKGEDKVIMPGQAPILLPSGTFTSTKFDANGIATQTSSKDMPVTFGADQKIDSMIAKVMTLVLSGNSTYQNPGQLIITFPDMVKDGSAFTDTFEIGANSTFNQNTENKADGYHLKFKSSVMGQSVMPMNIKLILHGTPNANIGNGALNANLQLGNAGEMKYHVLYGYIGQTDVINVTDSMNIEFLNRTLAKNVEWAEPKLSLFMVNSYAVPVELTCSNMSVYSEQNNNIYPIILADSINPRRLKSPSKAYNFVNDAAVYSRHNSTLFEALEKAPKMLHYKLVARTNPDGYNVNVRNELTDTSIIRSKMQFHLPLWFRSSGFSQEDTLDFDIMGNDKESKNSMESMLFRIIAENGMPVDMDLQLTFTDANYVPLETLFKTADQTIVKSAAVTSDGIVANATRGYRDIVFDASQLKSMEKTKKIIVKVLFRTAAYAPVTGPYVKFYSNYKLKLSFSCQFQPRIKL